MVLQSNKTKMVYVAHPFNGENHNVKAVEDIVRMLIKKYPDIAFYSPLHATGFFYHDVPYEKGMEYCFEALSRCDELWIAGGWRESKGCCMEYGFAKAKGIPVKFISEVD